MANETIQVSGAMPASVRFEERYRYSQEISSNPRLSAAANPSGQIEVVVPYDGHACFTRAARQSVADELESRSLSGDVDAVIGSLSMSGYDRTDLHADLALEVPVLGRGISIPDDLCADGYVCRINHEYHPELPEVHPIDVHMELLDEDILDLAGDYLRGQARRADEVVAEIIQQVSFKRSLFLAIEVRLNIPCSDTVVASVSARVSRVTLTWPTLTHFRTFRLQLGHFNASEALVSYNPLTRSLEWFNVEIQESKVPSPAGLKTYISELMVLLIDQPGELYTRSFLKGRIEVEIRGLLLSGLRASVNGYGRQQKDDRSPRTGQPGAGPSAGQGRPSGEARLAGGENTSAEASGQGAPTGGLDGAEGRPSRPELITRLDDEVTLVLDDAFRERKRAPFQQLHFDGVIPDLMRLADIKTALSDRGFQIKVETPLAGEQQCLKHFIIAERPDQHTTMKIWIVVDGNRYTTERRTEVPGGQVYTSIFESGEVRIFMRGEMAGESRGLIREMNIIQLALRKRFEHLRVRR